MNVSEESQPLLLEQQRTSSVFKETSWIVRNGSFIAGTIFLTQIVQLAGVITIGHLSRQELAGYALGNMLQIGIGLAISAGFFNALDTLCSQAWTGAADKTLLGLQLQRVIIMIGLAYIPLGVLYLNAARFFVTIGQDPDVSYYAGLYLRYTLLGSPALDLFESVRVYLQAQGVMYASTVCQLIATPIGLVLIYGLVYTYDLGFIGVPLALSLTNWIRLMLLLFYARLVRGSEGWGGWSKESLKGWSQVLRFAGPTILACLADLWSTQFVSLGASYLSTSQLAAQSILLTLDAISYPLGWGLGGASSVRVGNTIGEGNPGHLHLTIKSTFMLVPCVGFLLSAVFLTQRWGSHFTPDDDGVIREVDSAMAVFTFSAVSWAGTIITTGILRGAGKPEVSAVVSFVKSYLIGIPLAYYLAFERGMGIRGLWLGVAVGTAAALVAQTIYILRLDQVKLIRQSLERIKKQQTV